MTWMESLKVSIVTPSYNQAKYLREAIDSVANQDYEGQIEHLVIDGGSTDESVAVLQAVPTVRWVSERDRGQSDALNKGLSKATGEIIGWLNADDYYLQGAVRSAVEYLALHPEVDVVYGDCAFVDAEGRVLRLKAEHGFSRWVLTHFGCYIPSTATFFRRKLVDSGDLRLVEDLHFVMDYELYLHLASVGARFAWLPKSLAAFRWTDSNKSLDVKRRVTERHQVQDRYAVRPRGASARAAMFQVSRSVHLLMKLLSGSLERQQRWKSRRGQQLDWTWSDI